MEKYRDIGTNRFGETRGGHPLTFDDKTV